MYYRFLATRLTCCRWASNPGDIDTRKEIILPTSRDIRITMTATNSNPDMGYFGTELSHIAACRLRFLRARSHLWRTPSLPAWARQMNCRAFLPAAGCGPGCDKCRHSNVATVLLGNLNANNPPAMVQRLASQVGVENKGFTLVGKKIGDQYIQFGCARDIRHSLAPDYANITFSTKSDLLNHWVIALNLQLNRDWSWDALKPDSILVERIMKFSADGPITGADPYEPVGYMRLGTSANDIALINPDRTKTNFLFFDAVRAYKPANGKFPDTIQLQYRVTPQFVASPTADAPLVLPLLLPVTTTPATNTCAGICGLCAHALPGTQ